uniref:Putative ovule protein n=1 Tax=Solanum chacoense TaxID=4108 RepID=A0A0V0HKE3_SOLCH
MLSSLVYKHLYEPAPMFILLSMHHFTGCFPIAHPSLTPPSSSILGSHTPYSFLLVASSVEYTSILVSIQGCGLLVNEMG